MKLVDICWWTTGLFGTAGAEADKKQLTPEEVGGSNGQDLMVGPVADAFARCRHDGNIRCVLANYRMLQIHICTLMIHIDLY